MYLNWELYCVLKATENMLPADFLNAHQRLFKEAEHLLKLSSNLSTFYQQGVPKKQPEPYFDVECTPPLIESYVFFENALKKWFEKGAFSEDTIHIENFAYAIHQAQCAHILLLLGQRRTPASLTDHRGIPPAQKTLITSASQVYKQQLTFGARAWTKHASRTNDGFWGTPVGTTAMKNEASLKKIRYILDHTTWWNIFEHYQHDTVYEARIPSGHGVRWGKQGEELIGFLEPFLEEEVTKKMMAMKG